MSHHVYTTPGLVLESAPTGEASGMYSVFTRDLGMIRARAQGVRLQKSKLKPALQDFCWSTLSLVRGQEIWRIVNAQADRDLYRHFKERAAGKTPDDKEGIMMLGRVFFILRRLLAGEEKNESLFEILENSFLFAQEHNLSPAEIQSFEYILVLKILDNLGYRGRDPRLDHFVADAINPELITAMQALKNHAAGTINAALRESHL